MHNIIFIRRRFGRDKGNRILLVLGMLSLLLLIIGGLLLLSMG
jgi:hypothetical protein